MQLWLFECNRLKNSFKENLSCFDREEEDSELTGTDALGRHIVEKSRRVRGAHSATDASSDPVTLRMRRVNIYSQARLFLLSGSREISDKSMGRSRK